MTLNTKYVLMIIDAALFLVIKVHYSQQLSRSKNDINILKISPWRKEILFKFVCVDFSCPLTSTFNETLLCPPERKIIILLHSLSFLDILHVTFDELLHSP